jgi:predicted dithiol-disulfide oxidoreductase (DUF899 family)
MSTVLTEPTTAQAHFDHPRVVSHDQWIAARKDFLAKEKEFTRQRDELSRERRELPWEKVDKQYAFEGPNGRMTMADLFDGRSQLIVYHFMLGPGWAAGCPSCSYLGDHFDGAKLHLANRDTTLVVISRAPMAEIAAFQQRMGWNFMWVSSFGTDFNFDYGVSFTPEQLAQHKVDYNYGTTDNANDELPGLSVFAKSASGELFHTYSTYARGLDILVGTYHFLDLTPKGRDEEGMTPHSMAWVRHHDHYSQSYFADQPRSVPALSEASAKSAGHSCCSGS